MIREHLEKGSPHLYKGPARLPAIDMYTPAKYSVFGEVENVEMPRSPLSAHSADVPSGSTRVRI